VRHRKIFLDSLTGYPNTIQRIRLHDTNPRKLLAVHRLGMTEAIGPAEFSWVWKLPAEKRIFGSNL
jgi:hypothetical protein